MSPQRSIAKTDSRKDFIDDSMRYIGRLNGFRESESSLRDSVRLCNSPYHSGENHNLESVAHEPRFFFMCGRCDMLVGEKDKICQFCGAEFIEADEPDEQIGSPGDTDPADEGEEEIKPRRELESVKMSPHNHVNVDQENAAGRVDVLSMLADGRSRLGIEHLAGGSSFAFANYARILRRIETMINEANDFGAETEGARRVLLAAWKACHEGKWNRAMQLADESRKALAPGVTHLVQGQISCLREAIIEMKRMGRVVTPLVIEIKTIQRALEDLRMDEAIRLTKAIISEIKQAQMHLLDNMDSADGGEGVAFCGSGI